MMNNQNPAGSAEALEIPEIKPPVCQLETCKTGRMLHVGVLSNPLSGGNRKGLDGIKGILAGHSHASHCEVQTPSEVVSALADFARKEVDVIAVNGGDGTIQAVHTALFHHQPFETLPFLALLRAGTDSIIARDIGLRGSRDRALRMLLNWARAGRGGDVIRQRPILRVQLKPDLEPLYGMIFGAAVAYQGIQFCRRRIHRLGLHGELAPGLTLARFLMAVARRDRRYVNAVPLRIGLNQNPPFQQDFLLVLICTLERLFLGLRPYWGTENGPLRFTAVSGRPRRLLRALPLLACGRKSRHATAENGYFSHNVHVVRLSLNSGFTLDGQLYQPDPGSPPLIVQYGGHASFLRL
jgi:diacylglycerol kinase (ATP)